MAERKPATSKGFTAEERGTAERLHALISASAPDLSPRTWYGMPAYARDGQVVCFVQNSQKFKTRYATVGFSDKANLDEGDLWPTPFALKKLTTAGERKIRAVVKKAVSCRPRNAMPLLATPRPNRG